MESNADILESFLYVYSKCEIIDSNEVFWICLEKRLFVDRDFPTSYQGYYVL